MQTIHYLRFEIFKNNSLLWDTYLSSACTCILIKATIPMFLQEFNWSGEICYTNITVSSSLDLLLGE